MKKSDIPGLIGRGEFDEYLDSIINFAVDRRKVLREIATEEVAMQLKKGMKVRLVAVRPRYLNGYEATVVVPRTPKKHGYCTIDIDAHGLQRIRRYPTKDLMVPISTLEIVE